MRVLHRIFVFFAQIVAQFHDAYVGIFLFGEFGEIGLVESRFDPVQVFQRLAQIHEYEIRFLADDGVDRRTALSVLSRYGEFLHEFLKLFQCARAFFLIGRFPARPVDRTEIVQTVPAFERQRSFVHLIRSLLNRIVWWRFSQAFPQKSILRNQVPSIARSAFPGTPIFHCNAGEKRRAIQACVKNEIGFFGKRPQPTRQAEPAFAKSCEFRSAEACGQEAFGYSRNFGFFPRFSARGIVVK